MSGADEGTFDDLWWVGLLLTLMASLTGVGGKMLFKMSHTVKAQQRSWLATDSWFTRARVLFIAGLFLTAVCNPLFFLGAYAFAAQSLVVPFSGFSIVFSTVLAPLVLKEAVTRAAIIGTCITALGCSLVAVSGSKETRDFPSEDLISRYNEETFVALILIEAVWCGFLAAVFFYSNRGWRHPSDARARRERAVTDSPESSGQRRAHSAASRESIDEAEASTGTDEDRLSTEEQSPPDSHSLVPVMPPSVMLRLGVVTAALGGTLGGNHFFVKSTTEVLKDAYNGESDMWSRYEVYLIFAGAITLTVSGLVLLNIALRYTDAVLAIPIYQGMLIITGSVTGLAFFDEWDDLDRWQAVMYPIAVSITLVGLGVFATRKPPTATIVATAVREPTKKLETIATDMPPSATPLAKAEPMSSMTPTAAALSAAAPPSGLRLELLPSADIEANNQAEDQADAAAAGVVVSEAQLDVEIVDTITT